MVFVWWVSGCVQSSTGPSSEGEPTGEEVPPRPPVVLEGPLTFGTAGTPTNLLVVSLDTTRRDRIGRYSGLPTTPFLDGWFKQAVVLDTHRSCSNWTGPSMLCVTTGKTPAELGFFAAQFTEKPIATVASLLSEVGYDTRLVTANEAFFGVEDARGFGVIQQVEENAAAVLTPALTHAQELVTQSRPWYLHVHFMDPHQPLCPPERFLTGLDALPPVDVEFCESGLDGVSDLNDPVLLQHVELRYQAELQYFDETFSEMWSSLEAMGALEDTLVMFVTDHGEQFAERRAAIGHGKDLYVEENAAAAAFWARTLAPAVHEGTTSHVDLGATLMALYSITPPVEPPIGLPVGTAPSDYVIRGLSLLDEQPTVSVVQGRGSSRFIGTERGPSTTRPPIPNSEPTCTRPPIRVSTCCGRSSRRPWPPCSAGWTWTALKTSRVEPGSARRVRQRTLFRRRALVRWAGGVLTRRCQLQEMDMDYLVNGYFAERTAPWT